MKCSGICLLAAVLAWGALGCRDRKPAPETGSEEPALAMQAKLPPETPTPKPGKPAPNLVRNFTFDKWDINQPTSWQLDGGEISRSLDLKSGETSVQFKPNYAYEGTRLYQEIVADRVAGRRFEAKVRARAANKMAYLYVIYFVNGQQKSFQTRHTGSGEWRTLKITGQFPPDADPSPLGIRMNLLPGESLAAEFDQAEFRFLD